MKSSRYFWLLSTIAFVLTWFVVIPYLASNPRIDLTAPVAAADHFTDNRGLTMTVDKASQECLVAVYIAGSKVAAKHASAPLDTPDRIYLQCMFEQGVLI